MPTSALKHLEILQKLLVSYLTFNSKNKHGNSGTSGTSENILLYKQMDFFEKQASDFQIALAYFAVFLSFCTSARNEANTLFLASCAQLLYRY